MRRLSKSTYLKGRQCPLRAWYAINGPPEPAIDPDEVWEEREAEGAAVEAQAATLFPTGVRIVLADDDPEVEERRGEVEALIAVSRQRLADGVPLFQVHFATDDLLAIVDIAEPRNGGWYLWEVKASTSLKPIFTYDLAFQAEVARRSGLRVAGVGIMHLNAAYVRGDALIADELLTRVDLSEEVATETAEVSKQVDALLAILRASTPPQATASNRCSGNPNAKSADRPSNCGHIERAGRCGSKLPEYWVWDLPRLSGEAKLNFLRSRPDQSIDTLRDEDSKWTVGQLRNITAVRQQTTIVDKIELTNKLTALRWPVAYMDFEFDPGMAVPRFKGTSPYTRLPFQWSVQIQHAHGDPLTEHSFLHDSCDDPRRAFFESLADVLPNEGSIVVHSRTAEVTVLRQLAAYLGHDAERVVADWESRIFDTVQLLEAGYYNPAQHGSYSLKKIAPALLGRGYEDLQIQSGMAAVIGWKQLISPTTAAATKQQVSNDLRHYCGRDTRLMHDMIEAVRAFAG